MVQKESIKINTAHTNKVRKVKELTGTPIGRFIEDAIDEKVDKLPVDIKRKMRK